MIEREPITLDLSSEILIATREIEEREVKLTAAQTAAINSVKDLVSTLTPGVPVALTGAQVTAIKTLATTFVSTIVPSILGSVLNLLGSIASSLTAANTVSNLFAPLTGKLVAGVPTTVSFTPAEISALQSLVTASVSAGTSLVTRATPLSQDNVAAARFFSILSGTASGAKNSTSGSTPSTITGLSGAAGVLNLVLGGIFSSVIKVALTTVQTAAINIMNALNAAGKIVPGATNFSATESNAITTATQLYQFLRLFISV